MSLHSWLPLFSDKSLQYPSVIEQVHLFCFFKTYEYEEVCRKEPNIKSPDSEEGWREMGGHAIWFHSKNHANCARYLNFFKDLRHIANWEYQPKTFRLKNKSSYTPDFGVKRNDGSSFWIVSQPVEIDSLEKIDLFQQKYPQEELRVVDFENDLEQKSFLAKVMHYILDWED